MAKYTSSSGIYIILNTKNGKVYIGKTSLGFNRRWQNHKNILKKGEHLNRHLQCAWNKYGGKFFKFLVLEYCTADKLNERETHYIKIYKARGLAYNITNGGEGAIGRVCSAEHRLKISVANKNPSPETRARMSAAQKGHVVSDEQRAKLSASLKGRARPPRSVEYRANISSSHMGHFVSEETRAKLSKSHTGKTMPEETRAKISAANKGKKKPPRTAEHQAKLNNARQRKR